MPEPRAHRSPRFRLRTLRTLPGTLLAGTGMLVLLAVVAVVAPVFLQGAAEQVTGAVRQGPGPEHLLGTDQLGRDVLARSLVATRLTLAMAAGATAVQVFFGVLIGAAVWVAPRPVREVALRVIDAFVAFPALVLALVVAAILGPGSVSAIIAIGIAGIPSFARLTSNMVAMVVQRDFVTTARLLGVRGGKLLTRHLLPNVSGPLVILSTSSFALALLEIASLSFVGLGVQSPAFDYGLLLSDGLTAIYAQPWQAIAPAAMLVYAGIAAMLLGDGLAVHFDPSLRRSARAARPASGIIPARTSSDPEALVELADLHVTAPDGSALVRGVSFAIRPGEIVGLVGESGSGKSMTAMSLAGLLGEGLTARASIMRIGDMDMTAKNSPRRLATEIGLVYQDPGSTFNPALRMGFQLAELARAHLGLGRGRARERIEQSLSEVRVRDAGERMRQHPFQWSGGMLQRAMISQAALVRPRLLVADEPTTALDVTVQADVLRLFRRINRENGTAVLFISHDIGVVQALCDRVLVMRGGEIIERLSGAQLAAGDVAHPYTRALLAASPRMDDALPAHRQGGDRD